MTISGSGFTGDANATMYISGPYTAVTLIMIDKQGNFAVTYATGLHFPTGHYEVSVTQSGLVAASSFDIP